MKRDIEVRTENSSILEKMVMKSRTNYITNQQRIEYSRDNLHVYKDLHDKIPSIVENTFTNQI